jgi:hypothetical protein
MSALGGGGKGQFAKRGSERTEYDEFGNPINRNTGTGSEDEFKTASFSMSSSVSSGTTADSSITAIDDDIEDQRTPRLLLALRAGVKSLIALLLVLAVV